jgi:hypothetical protein
MMNKGSFFWSCGLAVFVLACSSDEGRAKASNGTEPDDFGEAVPARTS